MLFNSYEFIFVFLPIVLVVFGYVGRYYDSRISIVWLSISSVIFYAWWSYTYLLLLIFSIFFNYFVGLAIINNDFKRKFWLLFGVVGNLLLIGYFKYYGFIVDNFSWLFGVAVDPVDVVLPLAISFFTFQQIAYLFDAYRGETDEHNFINYFLFVTFFPQLIAGPIIHHKNIIYQFSANLFGKINSYDLSLGVTIFSIGLFKKVVLADTAGDFSDPVFNSASNGSNILFFEAWAGAFAYTFQLYFDFSGYSDMAVGLARMFGVTLPVNFNSPYKAKNIIEFWRRWHITLSNFLRDYLYISLGGNRKGVKRRYVNLLITMLIGGLWHGAGWTFVVWGGMHGVFLVINHYWVSRCQGMIGFLTSNLKIWGVLSRLLTFVVVVVAWVVFRADSFDAAMMMYKGMFLCNDIIFHSRLEAYIPETVSSIFEIKYVGNGLGSFGSSYGVIFLFLLAAICFFLPNTYELCCGLAQDNCRMAFKFVWQPTVYWAFFVSVIFMISVFELSRPAHFLYFQF